MIFDVECAGPHVTPVVIAELELPVGSVPTGALDSMLCNDCGAVYVQAVGDRDWPNGRPPDVDLVCEILPTIRPADYVPASPPGYPSWAQPGDPLWPPRKKP